MHPWQTGPVVDMGDVGALVIVRVEAGSSVTNKYQGSTYALLIFYSKLNIKSLPFFLGIFAYFLSLIRWRAAYPLFTIFSVADFLGEKIKWDVQMSDICDLVLLSQFVFTAILISLIC